MKSLKILMIAPTSFFADYGGHVRILEEAVALASTSAALYGDWDATYSVLVFANAQLGRLDEARAALARLLQLLPGLTVSAYGELARFRDPARLAMVQRGLRLAGLPE